MPRLNPCLLLFLTVLALTGQVRAAHPGHDTEETWFGVYLREVKVGYSSSLVREGEDGSRFTEVTTVISATMLGGALELRSLSQSTYDPSGRPVVMRFESESGGRLVRVEAEFTETTIEATLEQDGRTQQRSIPIPTDAPIVDDPLALLDETVGSAEAYILDPSTVSLVKITLKREGEREITLDGQIVKAQVVLIQDARAPQTVFLSQKGDLLRIEGPIGLNLRPESEEVALSGLGETADLAFESSIKLPAPIPSPRTLREVELLITGVDLSHLPSDAQQTLVPVGDGWTLRLHPLDPAGRESATVDEAAAAQPRWTQPELRVPSDAERFRSLALEITGEESRVLPAAEKIRTYVNQRIAANPGIGVLRDADDILDTAEGVCRDHAILMATLLRARGIPTQIVSGLVYDSSQFFYHAWVEVWDGKDWIALDSTRPYPNLSPTYIKVAQGSVGEAFTNFLLDGAKIELIRAEAR